MNLNSLPTFFVHEDKILINKAVLRYVEGNIVIAGSIDVSAPSKFETLTVADQITAKIIKAETVQVRNLITDWEFKTEGSSTNSLVWKYDSEETLNDKGLSWKYGESGVHLLYRSGGNLVTNANLELSDNNEIRIGTETVLSRDKLGDTVAFSNLQRVGPLTTLTVTGDADFLRYVNINKLFVKEINSAVTLNNNLTANGSIIVNGNLSATSISVQTILDHNNRPIKLDEYKGNSESDLYGKGLSWSQGGINYQFIYGDNERLWTNLHIDLSAEKSYKINDVPVLSIDELGPGVTKSNLQKLGNLRSLNVIGNTSLGEFAYFNSDMMRVGLGTEDPDSALHIHDFGVDITIGSKEQGSASIGTKTYHDLNLITDDTTRISIKNSGEVVFGNSNSKNAQVYIFGTLHVDNIVSDTRVEKFSPLEFKASADSSVWGLGLKWKDINQSSSLLLAPNPTRIVSSEHFDILGSKSYHIDGIPVLSETALGDTVTSSKLTSLGILSSLDVSGNSNFNGLLTSQEINVNKITVTGYISSDRQIIMKAKGDTVYYADENGITIGNNQNTARPVKIFGPLSVGVNNPDPSLSFVVSGNVSLGGKKFVKKESAPTDGEFNIGDICWNINPAPGNFIGWVCISAGTPGQWAPFGQIV